MKKIIILTVVLFGLFSCSNDDAPATQDETNTFNLPLNSGNYWTYDIVGATNSRDSVYISGDTIITANTYKKFKTKNNIATGFYSSSLRNNGVRKSGNTLLLSGDFSVGQIQSLPLGLDLSLSDFIIFKETAANGEQLSTKSGSFMQTINAIPLNVEYALKSEGGQFFASFTSPNGEVYTNVITTKIKVSLKVTTTQVVAGIPFTVTVLQPQDVISSVQYIAKNIGVVHTKTLTSYVLDGTIANSLGIPASFSENQSEFLDVYNVN